MASAHDGSRHPIMSVGFVGMYPGALDLVNTIVDADLFHCDSLEGMDVTDAHEPFHVQAQRMADQHMVCMFLDAVMDMSALMQLHAGIVASGPSVGGFEAFLEGRQCQLTRALLLLFSVCHVVIFVHKGHIFDFYYLRLLRSLQLLKQQLTPTLHSLVSHSSSPSLAAPGRLLPVLAFVFAVRPQPAPPAQAQRSLETQIRILLRKSKLSGPDTPSTPLFLLDPQCLCFVMAHTPSTGTSTELFGQFLFDTLLPSHPEGKPASAEPSLENIDGAQEVWDFLMRQFAFFKRQMAKGGRRYELLPLEAWKHEMEAWDRVVRCGKERALREGQRHQQRFDPFDRVKAVNNPLAKFSYNRCQHGYAMARESYVDGWAKMVVGNLADMEEVCHVPEAHANLLDAALVAYAVHGVGRFYVQLRDALVEECCALFEQKRRSHRLRQKTAKAKLDGRRKNARGPPADCPEFVEAVAEDQEQYLFDTLPAQLYRHDASPDEKAAGEEVLDSDASHSSSDAEKDPQDGFIDVDDEDESGSNDIVPAKPPRHTTPVHAEPSSWSEHGDRYKGATAGELFCWTHAVCNCGRTATSYPVPVDLKAAGAHFFAGAQCCDATFYEMLLQSTEHALNAEGQADKPHGPAFLHLCFLSHAPYYAGLRGNPFFDGLDKFGLFRVPVTRDSDQALEVVAEVPGDMEPSAAERDGHVLGASAAAAGETTLCSGDRPPTLPPTQFALGTLLSGFKAKLPSKQTSSGRKAALAKSTSDAASKKPTRVAASPGPKAAKAPAAKEGTSRRKRRQAQEADEAQRDGARDRDSWAKGSVGDPADPPRPSVTIRLGFEYENAMDGGRWLMDPAEVLRLSGHGEAQDGADSGIPLFVTAPSPVTHDYDTPTTRRQGPGDPRGLGGRELPNDGRAQDKRPWSSPDEMGSAGLALLQRIFIVVPDSDAVWALCPIIEFYKPPDLRSLVEALAGGPLANPVGSAPLPKGVLRASPTTAPPQPQAPSQPPPAELLERLQPPNEVVLPRNSVVALRFPYSFPSVKYSEFLPEQLCQFRLKWPFLRVSGT